MKSTAPPLSDTVKRAYDKVVKKFPTSKAAKRTCIELAQKLPKMSEEGLIAGAELAEQFERFALFTALAAEYGEPNSGLAASFVLKDFTAEDAKREFAKLSAQRIWAEKLSEAQTQH